jgi:hypothetical protein
VRAACGALWQAIAVVDGRASGVPGEVWGPALLAMAYLATAVGVVRMRAWGVLLGAAAALTSIACAIPVLHEVNALRLAFVCIPGALLAAPVVASRLAKKGRSGVRVEPADAACTRFVTEAPSVCIEVAPESTEALLWEDTALPRLAEGRAGGEDETER